MPASDIFADIPTGVPFARYATALQIRDLLIGGVPKDPDTIKGWLSTRLELDDRELLELTTQTAEEMQEASKTDEDPEGKRPSGSELIAEVAKQYAKGNGFKRRDGAGLVVEGRILKAMLKEAMNVAFPGLQWPGKASMPKGFRKGLMSAAAERVFVEEMWVPLGVDRASGTEQRIKHVSTPQGPRSAINVVDYVERPRIEFTVLVWKDFLPPEAWRDIWTVAEEIGLGADRARSDGKFDLEQWKRLN